MGTDMADHGSEISYVTCPLPKSCRSLYSTDFSPEGQSLIPHKDFVTNYLTAHS